MFLFIIIFFAAAFIFYMHTMCSNIDGVIVNYFMVKSIGSIKYLGRIATCEDTPSPQSYHRIGYLSIGHLVN